MNDIAIRVENLSKRYRLGEREPYKALRDVVTKAMTAPFRRLRSAFKRSNVPTFQRSNDYIWALKDVSFEVKRGEVIGIIGRNGAGKTTLLKILSRITEPTEGYAELHGRVGSLLEVGTGFHPELTGRENIYLSGAILGMKKAEIERKFDEIVAFAELEKFIDTPVKRYSSGMFVRLAFAVAAHLEPEILLVDEVLAVGDAAFQKKCLGKMGDVAKEGRTVLFVSHNMAAVSRLCGKVMWLDNGEVRDAGNPNTVISAYLLTDVTTMARIMFPIDESKPAQIVSARLLDSTGHENHVFRVGEPFYVELKFRVRERLAGWRIGMRVQLPDGTEVFSTSSADRGGFPHKLERGVYIAHMTVPGNLLASRDYLTTFFLGQPGLRILDSYQRVLSFSIVGNPFPHNEHREGIIVYPFEWQLIRGEINGLGKQEWTT